jgi:hypothetical protein
MQGDAGNENQVLTNGKEETNTVNDVCNSNMVTGNDLHLARFLLPFLQLPQLLLHLLLT